MPILLARLRSLFKARAFTPLAVITIALGLGATTAVFSVVDALLLSPRPGIADESALVDFGASRRGGPADNFDWPAYLDFRAQNHVFTDVAAAGLRAESAGFAVDGQAENAFVQWTSPNYFAVLGTRMAAGRDFTPTEAPTPEIVLSHRYWQRRFQGAPEVIGRTVLFNGAPVMVVGITEPGFAGNGLLAADFWAPYPLVEILDPASKLLRNRGNAILLGLARLKPGVTLAQARAELAVLAQGLEKAYPESYRDRGVAVTPSSRLPGEIHLAVTVGSTALLTLTGLALAVVCTNVAGLLLARGSARRRELCVRGALGATRRDLLVQLLTETLLLFLVGGLAGAVVAGWLISVFNASLLPSLPVLLSVAPAFNPLGFAFCLGVALVAGLVFGLGPAIHATRFDLFTALRDGDQAGGSGRFLSLRNVFLLIQLALSLALLTTSGLLVGALARTARTDPGFQTAQVEMVSFDLRAGGLTGATGPAFLADFLPRVAALPSVASAAWSAAIPLDGGRRGYGSVWTPTTERTRENEIRTDWNLISPAYFATLGIPLVTGRDFAPTDLAGAERVAIVNETFARSLWPGQSALGQTLINDEGLPVTIVGVARDVKYQSLSEEAHNHLYVPCAQVYDRRLTLFVKTRDAGTALPKIRALLAQTLPGLPIARTQSLESAAASSLLPYRVASAVAAGAGGLSLLLAGMGVYGSTLYWGVSPDAGIRRAPRAGCDSPPAHCPRSARQPDRRRRRRGAGSCRRLWARPAGAVLPLRRAGDGRLRLPRHRRVLPRAGRPRRLAAGPARDARGPGWWPCARSETEDAPAKRPPRQIQKALCAKAVRFHNRRMSAAALPDVEEAAARLIAATERSPSFRSLMDGTAGVKLYGDWLAQTAHYAAITKDVLERAGTTLAAAGGAWAALAPELSTHGHEEGVENPVIMDDLAALRIDLAQVAPVPPVEVYCAMMQSISRRADWAIGITGVILTLERLAEACAPVIYDHLHRAGAAEIREALRFVEAHRDETEHLERMVQVIARSPTEGDFAIRWCARQTVLFYEGLLAHLDSSRAVIA